ncbi:dTDP-4-dehydrorhamnose reductase [Odoribacter sp. OttesenSCG-928-J03]|nr:dTDP-4-dehydrorhamnose reductase [Odoribacter sp. OttesenSCG-928-J03]MDL2330457.1 dTDP-4-dehydrorhamnose reductase [Odoribacter sp. OttesenSCG-928-A06]
MNILITGAKGQLGLELQKIGFTALDEEFYTDVDELDITDYDAVEDFVSKNEIDTIINCAAYTAVDKAEDEQEVATEINTKAVANLAKIAYNNDCLLVHISTDYVFDGMAEEPYTEKSKTNPQSVYGHTKLAGEKAILSSGCLEIIIRTSWLYSEFGSNFVKTIKRLATEKEELNVVADQIGSPTYAVDLAKAIVAIVTDNELVDKTGIYHFSNEGVCSWYEFAKEIVKQLKLSCVINPVTTDQYPTKAKRPAYSVMDKSKIKKAFNIDIPEWKDGLKRCLKAMQ